MVPLLGHPSAHFVPDQPYRETNHLTPIENVLWSAESLHTAITRLAVRRVSARGRAYDAQNKCRTSSMAFDDAYHSKMQGVARLPGCEVESEVAQLDQRGALSGSPAPCRAAEFGAGLRAEATAREAALVPPFLPFSFILTPPRLAHHASRSHLTLPSGCLVEVDTHPAHHLDRRSPRVTRSVQGKGRRVKVERDFD